MTPNKICVIGALGLKSTEQASDGQVIKTKELYALLSRLYGEDRVTAVDTLHWTSRVPGMLINLIQAVRSSDTVIMLPAQNGVQVFSRLLLMLKKPGIKLFYDVIGGWIGELLKQRPGVLESLKQFDGIWVETTYLKKTLSDLGLSNVAVVPNFKNLKILTPEEPVFPEAMPYKLCTFSRVMQEKGIEDAISAVEQINGKYGKPMVCLDIYGKVSPEYADRFTRLQERFPGYIRYMGIAKSEESVEILKDYYALLFPTRFYTEGIPGTVIDAFCAGVPVIFSRWQNWNDILDEGMTGFGYDFYEINGLERVLEQALHNPEAVRNMKLHCLKKAEAYLPETVGKEIMKRIGEVE